MMIKVMMKDGTEMRLSDYYEACDCGAADINGGLADGELERIKLATKIEPVTDAYKLHDWTDQWDDCDVCESCEQLTKTSLHERLSTAVLTLYTHGILSATDRDKARKRLVKLQKADSNDE